MRTFSMLSLALVAVVSLIAAPQAVKHAPSLQSCVADINLWSSQIPGFPEASYDQWRGGFKSMTLREIDDRTSSLTDCVNAYPPLGKGQNGNLSVAVTISNYYGLETQARYLDFIYRHGLLRSFTEEDEAGKR